MLQESLINGRGFWLIHTDHKRGAGDGVFPYLGTACLEPVLSSPNQSISIRSQRLQEGFLHTGICQSILYTWNKISAPPPTRWEEGEGRVSVLNCLLKYSCPAGGSLLTSSNSHPKGDCKHYFSNSVVQTFPIRSLILQLRHTPRHQANILDERDQACDYIRQTDTS